METPEERAWREAYQSGMQRGSDACPGDETLAALVLGELSGDERAALARHISECRRCAEGYRTLRALHAEAGSRLPRRRRMRWPAVAATAVLTAGLGVALIWLGREPMPSGSDDAVRGDAPLDEMVRPADGAVLDVPPAVLSWPAQVGATGYRVRLYDEAANTLWEAPRVVDPTVVLAGVARMSLVAGEAYFWTVDVEGPVARSRLGPFWFRLGE